MLPGALGAIAVFVLVEAVLLVLRPLGYMTLAFPLPVEPLPLAHVPEGAGRTATVVWEVGGDIARYAAHSGGLLGLHGVVRFVRERHGVHLVVSWAPPWSLLAVASGIGFVGADAGVPWLSVPASVALFVVGLVMWQQAAVRAAAELRFAWSEAD